MTAPALIDRYLPVFDVSEHHEIEVDAPPAATYRAITELDLSRTLSVRVLLGLRAALSLLTPRRAVRQYGPIIRRRRLGMADLTSMGFVLLEERPDDEVVFGVVGKFWKPASGIRRIERDAFVPFDEPGYAKGVMNLQVRGTGDDSASTVATETRVLCTDPGATRAFLRYWRVIGPFSGFIRTRMLRMAKTEAESFARREAGTMDPEG